jgi:hypothetical protein
VCVQIKLEKAYSSNQALYSIVRTRSYHYTVYTRPVCTCTWIESRRLALARRREFGGGRRWPQTLRRCHRCRLTPSPPPPSPPLTPPPPSPPAPLLHLPLHDAIGIGRPHRCRPSLPPTPRPSPPPASAACIGHRHRRHLRRHRCQRERRLGRGRGRGLGYGYKVRVRVRVRERVATSQSGGPRRIQTSTALRP